MIRPAAAVGAVIVLRLVLGLAGFAPHIFPDEIGYIAAARGLATEPAFAVGPAPYYFPLYSMVISPAFALGLDQSAAFASVMVLNALLGGATAFAVYLAARRILGASAGPAAWAALVVGLFPGQSLLTVSIWAENLLPLAIIGWLLAVHWFLERSTIRRAGLVVLAALACYWTHPRSVVVIAVTAGIGFVIAVRQRTVARPMLVPAAVLVVGALLGYLMSRTLIGQVLGPFYDRSSISLQEGGSLTRLLAPASWDEVVVRLVGAVWYQVVSTGGLIVVGAWALSTRARPLLDRARRRPSETPAAGTTMALLAVVLGLLVGAAAFLSNGERADNFFAGRYVDAATPMVVAAGVVWVLQTRTAANLNRRFVTAASALLGSTVLVRLTAPELGDPRPFVGDMSLGLVGHISLVGGRRVVLMALVGLVVLASVWATARWRPPAALAPLAVVFVALGVLGRHGEMARPFALSASLEAFADDVARMADGAPVGVDLAYANAEDVGMLGYQWFRPELRFYDLPIGAKARSPWAIGPLRSENVLGRSGELVLLDPSRAVGLYVLPGAVQDGLRRRGALLQPDFPALLPATTAQSAIAGTTAQRVESGSTASVELTVSHRGTSGRWARFEPDGAGFSQGRIRVGARLTPSESGQPAERSWFADLPADLLPGQEAPIVLRIATGGADRLPPGRYTLVADVYQEGVGWFADLYGQSAHVMRLTVDPS